MDAEALVSLADVAEMAGTTRPAISNWRRRNKDFPVPVEETGATSLFRFGDIRRWAAEHGKVLEEPTVEQVVWSAASSERGATRPEDAAREGMALLGCLALAAKAGPAAETELRTAIARDEPRAVRALLELLDAPGVMDDIATVLGSDIGAWPQVNGFFLRTLLDLVPAYGTGTVFDALIAAVGRGAKGAGDQATPPGLAGLIIALAAPIGGVVLDPACGHGSMLLAAHRAGAPSTRLVGRDISPLACAISRLRMLAHDLPADITEGNSLSGTESSSAWGVDLVLADPTFPAGQALIWLTVAVGWLRPGGRALIVTESAPASWTENGVEIRIRLIERGRIRAVVELPPALYSYAPGPVTLWILGRDASPGRLEDPVLLIDAAELGQRRGKNRTDLLEPDIAAITECVRTWEDSGQVVAAGALRAVAVSAKALLARGGNVSPAYWIREQSSDPRQLPGQVDTAWRSLRAACQSAADGLAEPPALAAEPGNATVDTVQLRAIAEIVRARRIDPEWIGAGDTPYIRDQDVGPSLIVRPGGLVRVGGTTTRIDVTAPGDVVVATGPTLRAAVDLVGGALVSGPLHIVRVLPGRLPPVILAALINGATATADLPLLDLPVPDPALAERIALELVALDDQRRQLLAAVAAADQLSTGLVAALAAPGVRLVPDAEGSRP